MSWTPETDGELVAAADASAAALKGSPAWAGFDGYDRAQLLASMAFTAMIRAGTVRGCLYRGLAPPPPAPISFRDRHGRNHVFDLRHIPVTTIGGRRY
jgi:hypothetical protein